MSKLVERFFKIPSFARCSQWLCHLCRTVNPTNVGFLGVRYGTKPKLSRALLRMQCFAIGAIFNAPLWGHL
jgi:hypothetical protein